MKKFIKALSLILCTMFLCSCNNEDALLNESSDNYMTNPFDDIKKPESSLVVETLPPFDDSSDDSINDGDEDFAKYQTGYFFSDYSINGDKTVSYTGEDINLSFTCDLSGEIYDGELGFMAFVNGVPQKLSYNGSEKSELACVRQKAGTVDRITLSFTPEITEEYSKEEKLSVTIMTITHPSYKPRENYYGFGNAHTGMFFKKFYIRPETSLEIIPSIDFSTDYRSHLASGKTLAEYDLDVSQINGTNMINLYDSSFEKRELTLEKDSDKLQIGVKMYGGEADNYNVYIYKNNERVSPAMAVDVKEGYFCTFVATLDNVHKGDIIYLVEVPLKDSEKGTNVRKSTSIVVREESKDAER